MDTWRSQGRVLPLFASVPRLVSNATACRYSQLRRSLPKRAVDANRVDRVSASDAGQFAPALHTHPP